MLATALYKPFSPENTGLWSTPGGESIVVGFLANPPAGTEELLGWWIVPLGLAFGAGGLYLTKRLLDILKEKY